MSTVRFGSSNRCDLNKPLQFKWKDKDNPVAKLTGERLEILLDQREGYESCIILASLFYLEMLRFPESYEEHPITVSTTIIFGTENTALSNLCSSGGRSLQGK